MQAYSKKHNYLWSAVVTYESFHEIDFNDIKHKLVTTYNRTYIIKGYIPKYIHGGLTMDPPFDEILKQSLHSLVVAYSSCN